MEIYLLVTWHVYVSLKFSLGDLFTVTFKLLQMSNSLIQVKKCIQTFLYVNLFTTRKNEV